jgi:hypothetical protein
MQLNTRYTGDIDIWINRTDKNISLVLDALREFGFGELGISVADLSAPNSVVHTATHQRASICCRR